MEQDKSQSIGKICIPGMRLCAATKDRIGGPGTNVLQGYIYATLAGILKSIEDKEKKVKSNLSKTTSLFLNLFNLNKFSGYNHICRKSNNTKYPAETRRCGYCESDCCQFPSCSLHNTMCRSTPGQTI